MKIFYHGVLVLALVALTGCATGTYTVVTATAQCDPCRGPAGRVEPREECEPCEECEECGPVILERVDPCDECFREEMEK
ncbi:MAG: hypothetical protein ACLFTV_06645 [Desulfococcaceae bacterium]